MVLRIGPALILFVILTGFTAPKLPRDSRGVYNFEPVNGGTGFQTQTGGIFSLTVGFKRSAIAASEAGHSHRDRAQELVDKLAKRFAHLSIPNTEITVGKLYSSTREIIINVRVEDPGQTEAVRTELTKFLAKTAGVSFVGAPGVVRID